MNLIIAILLLKTLPDLPDILNMTKLHNKDQDFMATVVLLTI